MQGLPHLKILVGVTWHRNAAGEIVREDFYWIYDGRGQHAEWYVVEHAIDMLRKHFAPQGIKRVVCCSDNCACQFKCCTVFLGMSLLQHRWGTACLLEWLYGGAERFKWVHDTAGGWVKHALRTEVQRFSDVHKDAITDAASAVRFLIGSAEAPAPGRVVRDRHFFHLDLAVLTQLKRNVKRSKSTVAGTRGFHAVRPCAEVPGRLYVRERGCACAHAGCLAGDFSAGRCDNSDYVPVWRPVDVTQSDTATQEEEVDAEEPEAVIHVGSVVAIASYADEDDPPFFLVQITKASHILTETLSNDARKNGR